MTRKSGSLFSGFGGADIGARLAGFTTVWGIEYLDEIATVARSNGLPVQTRDILDCDPNGFEKVDHLHASPPCPNFSVAKVGAEETEHDIALADKVAEFITVLRPRLVTIENVPAYVKSKSYKRILKALSDCGYMYDAQVLNSADFGVPQTRKRLIVRAIQGALIPQLPEPVPWVGWYAAIEDLLDTLPESKFADWQMARLPDYLGETALVTNLKDLQSVKASVMTIDQPSTTIRTGYRPSWVERAFIANTNTSERGDVLREENRPAYTVTGEGSIGRSRAFITDARNGRMDGGGVTAIEAEKPMFTTVASNGPNRYRAFIVGDQEGQTRNETEPSNTIRSFSGGGAVPRAWLSEGRVVSMTPRALARFQSFPDWYKLPDKKALACKGIGNAVPPLMMAKILEAMQ